MRFPVSNAISMATYSITLFNTALSKIPVNLGHPSGLEGSKCRSEKAIHMRV